MANPFGALVDDEYLNTMPRYVGKKITQEDLAREAMHLINENEKNSKAEMYVKGLRDADDSNIATLCLVYNATGDTISFVAYKDWWGFLGRTPYPLEIGNGQWASFIHVCKSSRSNSNAAVVYRAKNNNGIFKDCLLAWCTPYGVVENVAYCEVGEVNFFQNNWDAMIEKSNFGNFSHTSSSNGVVIEVDTARGSKPIFRAIIKTPFNP